MRQMSVRLYDGLDRKIVNVLRVNSMRTNDVIRLVPGTKQTIIKHLEWLRKNGLVQTVDDPTHSQAVINVLVPPVHGFFEAIALLEHRAAELKQSKLQTKEHFERLMKDVVMPSMRLMFSIMKPDVGLRSATVAGLHWVNFLMDDVSIYVRDLIKSGTIDGQDILNALERADPELWRLMNPEARNVKVSP